MQLTPVLSTTAPTTSFAWACPRCRGGLALSDTAARCAACGESFARRDGIWRCLTAEDERAVAAFVREYETVRAAEGWGAADDAAYRALPDVPDGDPHRAIWRRRAASFDRLVAEVVAPLERERGRPLVILDLGAGNCWLAHRLARRGHHVAAIDLVTNDWDGLGAQVRYPDAAPFTAIQASFDRLPLAGGQADLAVFNASLHYARDAAATLAEALRVLRPDGRIAILDSPLYRDPAAGARMVREREAGFARFHGFPGNSLAGEGFLTDARLATLTGQIGLRWHLAGVPGWRRSLGAWRSRLRGERERATMPLIVGVREAGAAASSVLAVAPAPRQSARVAAARFLLRWRFRLFQRHRHGRLVLERVHGRPLVVLPGVFNPKLLRTGEFLAGALDARLIPPGGAVLDLGTGSGVGAIFAARWAGRVVATDINPEAARCARINTLLHRLEDRVAVREGDLFAPVVGERFDAILFNPPYFRGTPRDLPDHAWRSNDTVERFAAGLRDHLTAGGHALVVLSTDGETPAFLAAFAAHGFAVDIVAARDFVNEVVTIYRLTDTRRADPPARREHATPEGPPC